MKTSNLVFNQATQQITVSGNVNFAEYVTYFKRFGLLLTILLLNFSLLGGTGLKSKSANNQPAMPVFVTADQLKTDMRVLWQNNVILTRNVILCTVNFQPGFEVAGKALVNNQVEIANTVARYYGKDAGNKLTDLLFANITIAADVMIAVRNGHESAYAKADKKWSANTDEIIAFLSQTNVGMNSSDLREMMYLQMKYTTKEMTATKDKNQNSVKKAYDNAINSVATIADIFSDGVVKQFPDRFLNNSATVTLK